MRLLICLKYSLPTRQCHASSDVGYLMLYLLMDKTYIQVIVSLAAFVALKALCNGILKLLGCQVTMKSVGTSGYKVGTSLHTAVAPMISANQNWGVLNKRLWIIAFFLAAKTMLKLLWPLLIVNLRILGLVWRGTTYFYNKTTIILPGETRRTTTDAHDLILALN